MAQRSRRLYSMLAVLLVVCVPAAAEPPTMDERLAALTEQLEAARIDQHIPGMAIAIVKDDQVIFAHGFGLADIENETAVTPETIFAVGSTTKAFTATLIGTLVDEGLMSWDDPVGKYLPYFTPRIKSDDDNASATVRDLLSHRTGFTRMSLLWAGGTTTREEILRAANNAEPLAPYNEQFLYNNVMYMAAGMCAGAAADSTWETLITERLLEPLRMTDATLSIAEAQQQQNLSLGYAWDEEDEAWEHQPMRALDAIAPAGSINASVIDMANWIRLQLGRGVFEGNRIVSEESHGETWSPQRRIAGGVDYGLGWMLREHGGRRIVEHGGNIDGFAAAVALMPGENLGFVLLTNVSYAPIQQQCIGIVFDALLGDAPSAADESDAQSFDDAVGTYVANYAHFQNEEFTVAVNDDGALTIDIPSQTVFTLGPAGENGRMPFVGLPIEASFQRNAAGDVEMLQLYQGGLKFDVPREGYEYPIEIPLQELRNYHGTYRFEQMSTDVEVITKNNHLAVDVPGQLAFELHPPDDKGWRQVRNNDTMRLAVRFNESDAGEIESLSLSQMGQVFEMPRVSGPDTDDSLPTLDELMALRRVDERIRALKASGITQLSGDARMVHSGISGRLTWTFDAHDRFRNDLDLGRFGLIRTSITADAGWQDVSFSPFEELEGKWLEQAHYEHPAVQMDDWRNHYDDVAIVRRDDLDGRAVYVVRMQAGDRPASMSFVDAETGDVLKVEAKIELPGLGVHLPVTTELGDYREVGGMRLPHSIAVTTQHNGTMRVAVDTAKTNVDVPDDFFILSRDE